MSNDRLKAMTFSHPETIPVSVGILPAAWRTHRAALDELVTRFPAVLGNYRQDKRDYDAVTGTYQQGKHVDAWGCVWSNVAEGLESFVTGHPVPTREAVHCLEAPGEDTGLPHGFMFLRLTFLRGFEAMMIDFAEEPPELQMLIDIVLEYNLSQARLRLDSLRGQAQVVGFGDDLGMQNSLPISPKKWRRYLKPCYEKLYRPFRDAGHYVFMHSDGHIIEIIPDLVECGVNVINPQIRANGLEPLIEVCKGKVCVSLDLDRQMFPFCAPSDIDRHVREVVERLGAPEGGLCLQAEVGPDVPLANIEAICVALERYRTYYSG